MVKSRTPKHHSCPRGKKVYIKFKDGREEVDKFIDKAGNSRHILLERLGRVKLADLVVFTIHRPRPT